METMQFEIGDLVTYACPAHDYQIRRGIGQVVGYNFRQYCITWENMPKLQCPHPEVPIYPDGLLVKVGDRVKNLHSGSEGVVTHLSDRCMNIKSDEFIESHNLKLGKPQLKVLEKSKPDDFPELFDSPKTHGYLEEYMVINKQKKVYWYTRYVYQENSGKLKHHHVANKLRESIETLWRSGATAKQICTALGKSSK